MQDNILIIETISTPDFNNSDSSIIVPTKASQGEVRLYITVSVLNQGGGAPITLELNTNLHCYLVDSKTGFKYPIKAYRVEYEISNETFLIECRVDYSSIDDNTSIDFLEVQYSDLHAKTPVDVIRLQSNNTAFTYTTGTQNSTQSNLLTSRSKMAFPEWSTVSKNIISNYQKIMEPLQDIYETCLAKCNDSLRKCFDSEYEYQTFVSVPVSERPLSITQHKNGTSEDIPESTCIQRSEFDILQSGFYLKNNGTMNGDSIPLLNVFYNPLENFDIAILNTVLPSKLYIRKIDVIGNRYSECIIYGLDVNGNNIVESITARSAQPSETYNVFKKITKISSTYSVEISNYVDLSNVFYVDRNKFVTPLVVDKNYKLFSPLVSTITNSETTSIQLTLKDESDYTSEHLYKFNFNQDDISSIYLREDMSLIWTTNEVSGQFIHSGRLNLDMSKQTGNNTTVNNNNFISVSDTNTAIDDWVDITMNATAWFDYTEDSAFMIQCINNDNIYYYDPSTNELNSNYNYVYRTTFSDTQLFFSVLIENDQPYVFNIIPSDTANRKLAAMTIDNIIYADHKYPISQEEAVGLSLLNGQLVLLTKPEVGAINTSLGGIEFNDPYDVAIYIEWTGAPRLDYKLKIGNEFFSYNLKTMNSDMVQDAYNVISGGPQLIYLSAKNLDSSGIMAGDLIFEIGTAWHSDSYIPNITSSGSIFVITKDGRSWASSLSPTIHSDGVEDLEFSITIPQNNTIAISHVDL